MNVLQVTNTLHKGGTEAHLLLLAKGLQSHGVTCEVAFLRRTVAGGSVDLRDTFECAGIRTHYLRCEKAYDPRLGIRLGQVLARRRWDVLHSHLPRADAAAAICKLFNRRQTWISTLHLRYDDSTYSAAALIPIVASMWRRADGVIAVSEPVRQWSIEGLGVSPGAVRTIPHGVDLPRIDAAAPFINGRSEGAPRYCIGSIGRYEERKGHETLIQAMPAILKQFPEAQLKIAGPDPWGHGEVLKRLIADLNLGNHVQLVGFMSDQEAFFRDIDVFAFASRAEGFGIVVLEAMSAGKPVVVSNISPLRDIICPGKTGLVADREDPATFADAIISLFRDRNGMRQMGEEGARRAAQEFSPKSMVERTLQFYHEVTASRAASAH